MDRPLGGYLKTVIWLAVSAIPAATAQGVVQTIDASVSAEVREIIDGEVANTDQAFEDLDETTENLPLVVEADLSRLDGEVEVSAAGARTEFADPRLSTTPDPDEFGVDIAAFSQLTGIAYDGTSRAVETREITFTPEEILADAGLPLTARSQFFVDGIILIWGELDTSDLSGTTASVSFTVDQQRPTSPDPVRVLTAAVSLEGNPDGSATLTTDGELTSQNLVLIDLGSQVPEFGPVHLLIIPNTAIPYAYEAAVSEPFTLTATVEAGVANTPGTGASVELGVPLVELAGLINEATGGLAGDILTGIVQDAINNSPPPAKPLVPSEKGTEVTLAPGSRALSPFGLNLGPACGMLGIESGLFAGLMIGGMAAGRRRGLYSR